MMDRDSIIATLRANERNLRRQGVLRAALFGSAARQEATTESDIDIMVDLDPAADISVFDFVRIMQFIEELFPAQVDVADRASMRPFVRQTAERDAVYAF